MSQSRHTARLAGLCPTEFVIPVRRWVLGRRHLTWWWRDVHRSERPYVHCGCNCEVSVRLLASFYSVVDCLYILNVSSTSWQTSLWSVLIDRRSRPSPSTSGGFSTLTASRVSTSQYESALYALGHRPWYRLSVSHVVGSGCIMTAWHGLCALVVIIVRCALGISSFLLSDPLMVAPLDHLHLPVDLNAVPTDVAIDSLNVPSNLPAAPQIWLLCSFRSSGRPDFEPLNDRRMEWSPVHPTAHGASVWVPQCPAVRPPRRTFPLRTWCNVPSAPFPALLTDWTCSAFLCPLWTWPRSCKSYAPTVSSSEPPPGPAITPQSEFGPPRLTLFVEMPLDRYVNTLTAMINDGRFNHIGHAVVHFEGQTACGVWLRINSWDSSQGRRARLRAGVLYHVVGEPHVAISRLRFRSEATPSPPLPRLDLCHASCPPVCLPAWCWPAASCGPPNLPTPPCPEPAPPPHPPHAPDFSAPCVAPHRCQVCQELTSIVPWFHRTVHPILPPCGGVPRASSVGQSSTLPSPPSSPLPLHTCSRCGCSSPVHALLYRPLQPLSQPAMHPPSPLCFSAWPCCPSVAPWSLSLILPGLRLLLSSTWPLLCGLLLYPLHESSVPPQTTTASPTAELPTSWLFRASSTRLLCWFLQPSLHKPPLCAPRSLVPVNGAVTPPSLVQSLTLMLSTIGSWALSVAWTSWVSTSFVSRKPSHF